LPFVFRLPNDVDLVLPEQSEKSFREAALRDELGYKQELGRFSIGLGDFRAQVIPERMNIIDNMEEAIFESFDFSRYAHLVSERQLNLLGTSDSVRLRTHCLEVLLFIEWLRPPYTGSIYSTFFLFLAGQPEHRRLREILKDNKTLAPIVLAQLSRYVDLVLQVPFFDRERELVSRRIRVLSDQLA